MRRRGSCEGFWGRWGMSKRLGSLLRLEYGAALAAESRDGWGSPVFGSNGIVGYHSNFLVRGPAIVVGRKGSVGKVAWSPSNCWPIDTTYYVEPVGDADLRWVYHLLDWLPLGGLDTSTGIPGLNRNDVYALSVEHPDIHHQAAIARILDTLDTQIEKTQALIAKLEQVKEGLLHDLLTRGVDENGELRPSAEEAPELYKASPLGLIPRNWSVGTVEDVVESMTDGPFGSSLKTSHYVAEPGVRVVRLQNINRGWYDDNDRAYIRNVHATSLSRNLVHAGDLLVASLGDTNNPAGRACLYPADLPPAINKADCFRIRGLPNSASNAYLMLALNAGSASRQIRGNLQGVTLQRVNLRKLKSVVIPAPPLGEQSRICERFATVSDRKVQEAATLEILAASKSGLMDDLLTGRVRVTPLLESPHTTNLA